MKNNKGNISLGRKGIIYFLMVAFLFRVLLSFFGTLELDFNTFLAWSNRLQEFGFARFYGVWSDYLPGYLYVLWLLGKIKVFVSWFPVQFLYKLPAIISDVATGGLIYLIVKKIKGKEKIALLTAGLYLFNPAIFANSTLWGQIDSLTSFFSLLSVYLVEINPWLSALSLAVGASIKPQAAIAALVILIIMFRNKWKLRKIGKYVFFAGLIFVLSFLPFSNGKNIFLFIYERMTLTLNQYPYTSINAFNFWGFFGFWRKDAGIITPSVIGLLISLSLFIFLTLKTWKRKNFQYTLLAIAYLLNFLFFARMHERHLLPVFAPLAVSASLIPSLWIAYVGLSITYLTNLYYSYVWITEDFKMVFSQVVIKFFIISNLLFPLFSMKNIFFKKNKGSKKKDKNGIAELFHGIINNFSKFRRGGKTISFLKVKFSKKQARWVLLLIITFSLVTRLAWVAKPDREYFDEVYHAFTARRMLHHDPKAWEWWNPNPEGFAYEWTHPPLAKLGMWWGMVVLGEKPIGWRIPGAMLGILSVFLVYLIAKELFNDELLSLFSSGVFALDGLPLVMSRIGMNDSYFLFFILLSFYLYLKDKNFFSALSFGLAASSKWSAVWAVPIFIVAHFALKKKFRLSYLWFIFIPPLIYLASYIPMFLVGGHTLKTFVDVQRQMWWYHTNLKATHPYTSKWYTWPFLIRPIWLYTSGVISGKVANIYAMGNPAVFWMGLVSVFISLYYSFSEGDRKLALVIFSYLVFFIPWAVSPRIMFFYHYLPSIPFMAIAIGYVLRKNLKWAFPFFVLSFLLFIYFLPHFAGIPISQKLDGSYYWFNSWR